ncbi:MAG: single-stranded DNA-binding protein, partial [Bacteroidota bacterium]
MQIRNTVTLIGNIGQDPEVMHTKDGAPFIKFSLATNDRYRDKDGNQITRTEWHNIISFVPSKVAFLNVIFDQLHLAG